MNGIEFNETRPLDLILPGRIAIDFKPAYNDQVKEDFKPLKKARAFERFAGGFPVNIAAGVRHHGMNAGFIAKVSDDQFGDFVMDYFNAFGVDTTCVTRCTGGRKLGLTFTEMLSPSESSILMYCNQAADLQLSVSDIDKALFAQTEDALKETQIFSAKRQETQTFSHKSALLSKKARSPPPSFRHERYGHTVLPTSAHCSKFIGRVCVSLA